MRISRQAMLMEMAKVVAKRATCFRLNVGALVVQGNNNIIAYGYNGSPPGQPHCTGHTCAGASQCNQTIHAEVNAINRIPVTDEINEELDLYVTDSPCEACASYIIHEARIKRVFFATPYRLTTGLDKLLSLNIEVYRVLPAGYVIDWSTQQLIAEDQL